eukprot:1136823-Pelagomonas_calceolata.AAC.1
MDTGIFHAVGRIVPVEGGFNFIHSKKTCYEKDPTHTFDGTNKSAWISKGQGGFNWLGCAL